MAITLAVIEAARRTIAGRVLRTPMLLSALTRRPCRLIALEPSHRVRRSEARANPFGPFC